MLVIRWKSVLFPDSTQHVRWGLREDKQRRLEWGARNVSEAAQFATIAELIAAFAERGDALLLAPGADGAHIELVKLTPKPVAIEYDAEVIA